MNDKSKPCLFFLVFVLAVSLLLNACGGSSGDNVIDNSGNTGDAVPFVRSESIFDGAEQAFQAVLDGGGRLGEAYQAAAFYLSQQPEVSKVQFPKDLGNEAGFIAVLTNGLHYAIVFRDLVSPSDTIKAFTKARPPMNDLPSKSSGLPSQKQVLLIDTFWNIYQACADSGCPIISDIGEIRDLFEKYDYQVTLLTETSVDSFRNINNYDIVYIGTHGIYYEEDGVPHYALKTDVPRSMDDEENGMVSFIHILVIAEFNRGFGGIMKVNTRQYYVNEQFFAENTGAFHDDALVYVDACYSTTRENDFVPPPLFGVLSGFGLMTYLGWDSSVHSSSAVKASNYAFAQMLGDVPVTMAYLETPEPPIRPQGLYAAMMGLEEKGWMSDGEATLEHMDMTLGNRELLLRPGIDGMTLDVDIVDETQKLALTGDFGDVRGSVVLCDSLAQDADSCDDLTIDEWNDDEIIIDLGSDCTSGCTGGVKVVVNGRSGNVHPLTEWKGQFTVSGQYSSIGPEVNATIDAAFRAEIVDERATAEGDPEPAFSQAAAMLGLDSKVDYTFSGTFEDSSYIYEYDSEGNLTPSISGSNAFSGAVLMKPADGEADISITVLVEIPMTRTQKSSPYAQETIMTEVALPIYHQGSMEQYGTLTGDSVSLGSFSLTYDTINPTNPPDDETPR